MSLECSRLLSLPDITLMLLVSGLTLAVAFAFIRYSAPAPQKASAAANAGFGEISFTFVGERCTEASPSALELVNRDGPEMISPEMMTNALSSRFDALPSLLNEVLDIDTDIVETLPSSVRYDTAVLQVTISNDRSRFHICDNVIPSLADRHRAMTGRARLKLTYESLNKLPHPIWITSAKNQVLWSNNAYNSLVTPQSSTEPVFEFDTIKATQGSGDRVSIVHPPQGEQAHWFDISMFELDFDTYFNYAINVDGLIAAEIAQRKFVQTLAKTFAQLSIGLAIFDRDRRLVLFNPALVDLTSLPAHFLSAQPNLQSFFDQLRESRIMPEPKDYASWRSQIADLVVKSAGGNYQETWLLPSGLTYRVSGRPHPDGAIALLIEDITAEITLTRRFKGQIELSNVALETLKDAVVIFSPDGAVAFWNIAFTRFFELPEGLPDTEHSVQKFLQNCSHKFRPNEGLTTLQTILRKPHGSKATSGHVILKDGELLPYELRTHEGTSAIVTFHTAAGTTRRAAPKLVPSL